MTAKATITEALDEVIEKVQSQQKVLDILILKTPTGPTREALTEANIHLMASIQELNEAHSILNLDRVALKP